MIQPFCFEASHSFDLGALKLPYYYYYYRVLLLFPNGNVYNIIIQFCFDDQRTFVASLQPFGCHWGTTKLCKIKKLENLLKNRNT